MRPDANNTAPSGSRDGMRGERVRITQAEVHQLWRIEGPRVNTALGHVALINGSIFSYVFLPEIMMRPDPFRHALSTVL